MLLTQAEQIFATRLAPIWRRGSMSPERALSFRSCQLEMRATNYITPDYQIELVPDTEDHGGEKVSASQMTN